MNHSNPWARACVLASLAWLTACGGGSSGADADPTTPAPAPAPAPSPAPSPSPSPAPSPAPAPAPQPDTPPGGLYVGFYAEDATANPEDPTLGAFQMRLPEGNANFEGSMFFTYVGCQSSNVGSITGSKAGADIRGNIAGTVDGLAQTGSYSGAYDATAQRYTGTYVLAGGKQYRDLRPCIEYYIAPNGTFEMYPVGVSQPSSFKITVNGRNIQWGSLSGARQTLVYVLDPSITAAGANPVLWQGLVDSVVDAALPQAVSLVSGREYVAAVAVGSSSLQRLGFGSVRFVAP